MGGINLVACKGLDLLLPYCHLGYIVSIFFPQTQIFGSVHPRGPLSLQSGLKAQMGLLEGFRPASDPQKEQVQNGARSEPSKEANLYIYIYPPSDSPGCIGIVFSLSIFEPFFRRGSHGALGSKSSA